jgi:two-component system, NtrC family, sensor histidine kinase HydH
MHTMHVALTQPAARGPAPRPWHLIGAGVGLALGLVDTAAFVLIDVGDWLLPAMGLVFTLNLMLLGFLLGRLALAGGRAEIDAKTIQAQYDELEASQAAVVQAEKLAAIGRMAAGVAHEVRNPLGIIRSSASLVAEDLPAEAEDAQRACTFIVEETDRLEGMIRALLAFSRPAQAQLDTMSPSEAAGRALQLVRRQLERSDVTLREEVPELPEVTGDTDLISQLVFGLIINAAEVLTDGGTIAVRGGSDAAEVWLEVADDGPGVPGTDAERIFEPFFTTKTTGTGLGLPVAARIAQAHRGRLELRTAAGMGPEGAGACFRLSLPRTP